MAQEMAEKTVVEYLVETGYVYGGYTWHDLRSVCSSHPSLVAALFRPICQSCQLYHTHQRRQLHK